MKRFVIFGFLGPPLGTLLVILGASILVWFDGKAPRVFGPELFGMTGLALPFGYLLGIVPALLAALLDWFLERKSVRYRALWCALPCCWPALLLLPFPARNGVQLAMAVWLALICAIPAAVCSWVTKKWQEEAARYSPKESKPHAHET